MADRRKQTLHGHGVWLCRWVLRAVCGAVAVCLTLLIAEVICRLAASKAEIRGSGGVWEPHPVLGWVPKPGELYVRTHEFEAHHRVNSACMTGDEIGDIDSFDLHIVVLRDKPHARGSSFDRIEHSDFPE